MNVYLPYTARLPSEYQEVEYIESDGNQYINSLYYPNYNTEVYVKFAHNESVMDTPIFGCRANGSNTFVLWSHPSEYTASKTQCAFNGTTKTNITGYTVGTVIEFQYSRTGGYYKDTTWTWSPSSGGPGYPMIIFGLHNGNSTGIDGRHFSGKMWSFQIKENGTLVRDFIPCYRVSDNVIGLFDKVNNKFYTNAGTGTFAKGSDVGTFQPELKNAYIGEYVPPYLCFTANTAGSTVKLSYTSKRPNISLETSTDGVIWNDYTIGNTITLSSIGDKVYWRNKTQTDLGFSSSDYSCKFVMTGSISASGDINFLLNKYSTDTITADYCYQNLFNGCTSLTTAPVLSATTLTGIYCYNSMFYGCTNLTTAPELPATTLSYGCYTSMFQGCTSLTATPELPATTLTDTCYASMFRGCTNLRTATALPATTLAPSCYMYMFYQCNYLETLPALPATTLTSGVYYQMFYQCYNIKLSTTQTGTYQTPYRIPTTGTGSAGSNSLNNMFYYTGGTFTGTPSINTTYYTSNTVV